ncbi:MAG: 4'-phosphopantetheinyl transferase superfamily protein [Planctomycetes bacterium]|nr:4'-phosphopantetheinyl transferase superfamily protein [Planctomycetota bacterium]
MTAGEASARLRALFPEGVVAFACDPDRVHGALLPEEEQSLGHAAPKRIREFTAGRVLARRALDLLHLDSGPLLRRPDRTPVWPTGAVGSITHTRGFCGVAVALRSRVRGIGLDAERAADLKDELLPRVCTPREREWFESQAEESRGMLGKLLFSAKECVYKAQYAVTGRFLGFHEVEVEVEAKVGEFIARIRGTDMEVRGKFAVDGGFVLTGATI